VVSKIIEEKKKIWTSLVRAHRTIPISLLIKFHKIQGFLKIVDKNSVKTVKVLK